MPVYFGPFNKFWSHHLPLHLHIMNLRLADDGSISGSDRAVELLHSIIQEGNPEEIRKEIINMLRDQNWRTNMVGALCVLLLDKKQHEEYIPMIWQRLDERSWACPQLVAAAALLDKDFREKALSRLASMISSPPTLPMEKYMGSLYQALVMRFGPGGIPVPSAKGEVGMGKQLTEKWLNGLSHYFPNY